ncbi:MAG: ATP-binding protein [Rheinheimera sp.]|nr:ATP-binding protein [Rheinheimera sp.]
MQFEMSRLAVKPLLQQAILHNQPYAEKYQTQILLDAPVDGMIDIDPMRLHQILANLLSNAAKFSPPSSEIHVGLEIKDQQVQIAVTDQGPGIPEAFRTHIFEKFSQADSADARSKGGTGLGLAIVKELTNRMGGDISFTTSATGTSFTLNFALRGEAETNKPTVLVVEDDDQIALFIRQHLESAGYQVICCADLGSARRAMTLQSFVAVTLDLHLPDGHASTLFHELRSNPQHKDIPVLIATIDEEADPQLYDDFKGVSWLAKPLLAEQLVSTLQKLTQH